MKNKVLFIGDSYWGSENGTPDYLTRELLVRAPHLLWSFYINSSDRNSPESLIARAPKDIIGQQPEHIVFFLGWDYLQKSSADLTLYFKNLQHLFQEIQHNINPKIIVCTFPAYLYQHDPFLSKKMSQINEWIQTRDSIFSYQIADFLQISQAFFHQAQNKDNPHSRNLIDNSGRLNQLGQVLAGHAILKVFKF
jgi:hypothetical protein